MSNNRKTGLSGPLQFILVMLLLSFSAVAFARPVFLNEWQDRYGGVSASGDNAGCLLCHAPSDNSNNAAWNGYGWDLFLVLNDSEKTCDLNIDGTVSAGEAFFCVETLDSDRNNTDNLTEIAASAQPGWAPGAVNTIYTRTGESVNQPPPDDIGLLDPDGTEPPPPVLPPPGDGDDDLPPGQRKRDTIVVRPGQSIQAAIDRARPGTRIYILAGTYKEVGNRTNGLNVTKSGIRLIGQKTAKRGVVLENAGNQRNGIVVVPPDREEIGRAHV